MELSRRNKEIIYGLVLGDGYLQKTGVSNARLRIEHSIKQREYLEWLKENLGTVFPGKSVYLRRIHPKTKKSYSYLRLQSNSFSWLGKLQRFFYDEGGRKVIPSNIERMMRSPTTLAIWYMDDGYYYSRDKSAHIYIPRYSDKEIQNLISALKRNFNLSPMVYCRPDRNSCQLNFVGKELMKFLKIIGPYLTQSMRYKLPHDPVTTES